MLLYIYSRLSGQDVHAISTSVVYKGGLRTNEPYRILMVKFKF